MIGQTFGKLVVVHRAENVGHRAAYACRCSCGRTAIVVASRLRSGKTKSCGCLRATNMRAVAAKHGNSAHPLYTRWVRMLSRCYDPENNRFYRYGARGIKVCAAWHDFDVFVADVVDGYRPGLTIDRIDNDGDYEPGNVRWATYKTQARNRPACVVSEEVIAEARRLYTTTSLTQREVGEMFGFGRDTIKHYLRGLRAR